jgi:transcriptional regulator with XRE-family HTH domain
MRAELTAERLRRGLNQQQLGEVLGRRSYNTVSQWERGNNDPTLTNFVEWAAALGYTVTLVPADSLERAS